MSELEIQKPGEELPPEEGPEILEEVTEAPKESATETAAAAGEALLEVKKIEVKSLGETLSTLAGLITEVKTLTEDLKAGLTEIGAMKEELAYAITDAAKAEEKAAEVIEEAEPTGSTEAAGSTETTEPKPRKKMKLF